MREGFSGLLHPDPEGSGNVDYLICESTYSDIDRTDTPPSSRRDKLAEEVRAAMHPKGAQIIPSCAVERAQELISDLGSLMVGGTLPTIPFYIDSPLATRATEAFARHRNEIEHGAELMNTLRARWGGC